MVFIWFRSWGFKIRTQIFCFMVDGSIDDSSQVPRSITCTVTGSVVTLFSTSGWRVVQRPIVRLTLHCLDHHRASRDYAFSILATFQTDSLLQSWWSITWTMVGCPDSMNSTFGRWFRPMDHRKVNGPSPKLSLLILPLFCSDCPSYLSHLVLILKELKYHVKYINGYLKTHNYPKKKA